ncbi:PH, RCC1 and FYVE domains-containing protein 1 isoform X3 [Cucurbita maxima]|uniref:PH, RCC1 and FYVE domains-containing protein 1 isoform X3 n=1 Tax=Cucurbita maxima TaxID=3661 RepID=A0A6J1HRS2_CUCMA|nr:PH, RCC1 and FYVE domains-containing protein 1 isoform X3 [Cucurbita maxima]
MLARRRLAELIIGFNSETRRRRSRLLSSNSGKRFAAVWGNGDFGRLGLGNLDSQWRPVACSSFDREMLKDIACGGAHTLFLTESGRVYATGLNNFGQLGILEEQGYCTEPVEVRIQKEAVHIAAGYNHSCVVTADGELYMWGMNSSGQLGLGKRICDIIFFSMFIFFFSPDGGEVLSWGDGRSGRLGHGHESSLLGFLKSTSEYTPRLIKELEGIKVKRIAAGMLHSACVDENGAVFIFGERATNRLSFGEANKATTPSMISTLLDCEEVSCGGYHTCVLTKGGDLYSWGSNENGCLGNGSTSVFHLPEKVEGPFSKSPVSKVSCGWKHTAAISGGAIFTWGWGGSHGTFSVDGHSSGGQLGHGSDVDYVKPTMIDLGENVKAVQVSCGFNHTGAILEYM